MKKLQIIKTYLIIFMVCFIFVIMRFLFSDKENKVWDSLIQLLSSFSFSLLLLYLLIASNYFKFLKSKYDLE